jgi:hypothetical protein
VSGCGCRATQLDLRSEAAVGGGSPPLADAMTRKLRPSRGRSRLTAHSGILLVGEEHLSSSPSSLPSSMGCGWGMPILCCCSEGWYGAQGAAPACSIGKFSTSAAPPLAPCCVEGPGSIKLPPQWFSDSHCERPSLLLTREERWGKDDDEVAQVPTSSEGGCWLALLSLLILNLLVICVGLLLPFHLQHVHRRKRRRQITQRHTGLQFAGGYYSCRGRASRGGRSSSRGFTGHEEGIGRRKGGVGGLVCVCACM